MSDSILYAPGDTFRIWRSSWIYGQDIDIGTNCDREQRPVDEISVSVKPPV